jgi:transcriptional regulator with XRE-family HTH domain
MPLMENFRANISEACRKNGLSQQELARRSGVHWVTISKALSGKMEPSVTICEKLGEAAGLRPDTIFLEPVSTPVDTQ